MNLHDLLPIPEGSQKQIAMEWLEEWQKSGQKSLAPSTVESRLSDLRKEKIDGVRFFYNDVARGALLAEIMGLTHDQKEAARKRAEDLLLRDGQQQPCLVLVLAGLSQGTAEADQLFQQIKQDFLGEPPLLPLTLLVDEMQYDRLPRSFDDLKPRLSYLKVADAAQGSQKAEELAGDSAVVGRLQLMRPYDRWLALGWRRGRLHYAPAEGPAHIRESGRVAAPPEPTEDAEKWLEGEVPHVDLPTDPLELRHMVDQLGAPAATAAFGPLSKRVALGRALGVKVAATPQEVSEISARWERANIEAELAALQQQLGRPLAKGGAAEMDRLRQKATFAQVEPALFRIGDQLHLVGNAGLEAPTHPRLSVYCEEIRPTSLQRLLDVVDRMTLDDWRVDPLLERVIWRLAPEDEAERLRLFHARACLVLSGTLTPAKAEPVEDWRGALGKLLAGDPPAAQLLPQVEAKKMPWINKFFNLKPWVYHSKWMLSDRLSECPPLYLVPPLTSPPIKREEDLIFFTPKNEISSYDEYEKILKNSKVNLQQRRAALSNTRHTWAQNPPGALVTLDAALARDPKVWVELVQASPFLSGQVNNYDICQNYLGKLLMGGSLPDWHQTKMPIPHEVWRQADRELAIVWRALKQAIQRGEATVLHDGSVLLDLGVGIAADLNVRRFQAEEVEGMLWVEIRANQRGVWALQPLTSCAETHQARTGSYTTHIGYALPNCVTITGEGIAVDVRFFASPLLVAAPNASTFTVAAAVGATMAEEQHQEESMKYDDDD